MVNNYVLGLWLQLAGPRFPDWLQLNVAWPYEAESGTKVPPTRAASGRHRIRRH